MEQKIKLTISDDNHSVSSQYYGLEQSLRKAIALALYTNGKTYFKEIMFQELRSFDKSSAKIRRKPGDIIALNGPAGFGGDKGIYRILPEDQPSNCPLCQNPECLEWANLEELDSEGLPTGDNAYHVSECEMNNI